MITTPIEFVYKYGNSLAIAVSSMAGSGSRTMVGTGTVVKWICVVAIVAILNDHQVSALDNGLALTPPMGWMVG